jgi:hypothetical protein
VQALLRDVLNVDISPGALSESEAVCTWARTPGKKRADAPQKPPFASTGDGRLRKTAEYMPRAGTPDSAERITPPAPSART